MSNITQSTPLALARRYRPKTFEAVVGQAITLRALRYALDAQQLHHAYLFTGTRGVGKTSLARILAKSLNCEQGISSNPCNVCSACQSIDAGAFVDLIEVDAASRTKVEDIRELLDNVQYLPTRGRFKIYLIDEVHMLSGHSFNALLKTLEEPPSHVKFLLATTDPQKLPVTILSRCLQFHLRCLSFAEIHEKLCSILKIEQAAYEDEGILEIARAAEGSLRDALSLLDQALSYGKGRILANEVRNLLGLTEKGRLRELFSAICNDHAEKALEEVRHIASSAPDFSKVLSEFLTLLHHIAIAQKIPQALEDEILERESILKLATVVSKEQIQLYYQIGILCQRDLPYAPTPKMGFEMMVLRMLAFQPVESSDRASGFSRSSEFDVISDIPETLSYTSTSAKTQPQETSKTLPASKTAPVPKTVLNASLPSWNSSIPISNTEALSNTGTHAGTHVELRGAITIPTINDEKIPNDKFVIKDTEKRQVGSQKVVVLNVKTWPSLVAALDINGIAKELIQHCRFVETAMEPSNKTENSPEIPNQIYLTLEGSKKALLNARYEARIQEAISQYFGKKILVSITTESQEKEKQNLKMQPTPASVFKENANQAYLQARRTIEEDPQVKQLMDKFDAKIEQVSVDEKLT